MEKLVAFKRVRSKKEIFLTSIVALVPIGIIGYQFYPRLPEPTLWLQFCFSLAFLYFLFLFASSNTAIFYINEQGLLLGPHPSFIIAKILWKEIASVNLNPKNPHDLLLHLKQDNFVGRFVKTRHILFPLNEPSRFKSEIIKYAPVNNPLRVWVETN
jgi:hypothetical protein